MHLSQKNNNVQASRLTEISTKTGLLTYFNGNHESKTSIQTTPDLFIKAKQPAPLSRNNNIVQTSILVVEKSRKTVVQTQLNSNHGSELLIQNNPDFFINEQQISPLSRNNNIDQYSRLAEATTRKTVSLTPFNGNHES